MDAVPIHGRDHCPGGPDPIPCIGDAPWARVSKRAVSITNQTIASGSEQQVTFLDSVNGYPDYFTISVDGDEIQVDQNGLYSITARVFWLDWPGEHYIALNGIDPDAEGGYPASGANIAAHILFTVVHVDARLAAGQILYLTAYHEAGVGKRIFGDGGTYMEVRRLASSTVNDREAIFP